MTSSGRFSKLAHSRLCWGRGRFPAVAAEPGPASPPPAAAPEARWCTPPRPSPSAWRGAFRPCSTASAACARSLPPAGTTQHYAFAVHRDRQDRPRHLGANARGRSPGRHGPPAPAPGACPPAPPWFSPRSNDPSAASSAARRRTWCEYKRQIQKHPAGAGSAAPPIAEPLHPNLSKDRFQPPFLPPARLPHLPLRVPHRNGRLTRSPQLQVRLIEPSQQLPPLLSSSRSNSLCVTMGLESIWVNELPRRRELTGLVSHRSQRALPQSTIHQAPPRSALADPPASRARSSSPPDSSSPGS